MGMSSREAVGAWLSRVELVEQTEGRTQFPAYNFADFYETTRRVLIAINFAAQNRYEIISIGSVISSTPSVRSELRE
jgi:hypothetical protein